MYARHVCASGWRYADSARTLTTVLVTYLDRREQQLSIADDASEQAWAMAVMPDGRLVLASNSMVVRLGASGVSILQTLVVGGLGTWFLYYGLKAVQLTEMGNRVWKRTVEYSLILSERRRLAKLS